MTEECEWNKLRKLYFVFLLYTFYCTYIYTYIISSEAWSCGALSLLCENAFHLFSFKKLASFPLSLVYVGVGVWWTDLIAQLQQYWTPKANKDVTTILGLLFFRGFCYFTALHFSWENVQKICSVINTKAQHWWLDLLIMIM